MTEKETFTQLRNKQLKQHSKEEIVNFERKWGHLLYTPLDIPVIHDDLFAEWYFEKATPIQKLKEDVANHQKGFLKGIALKTIRVHKLLLFEISNLLKCSLYY